ncbi:hypothetical protein BMF94_6796 [Rhodotorula taiwanensis]|uniref:Major facilitator superfamily (MFS) profile domain-containing protein n=1 Tax=Rhodotorula taiwanensis TaxID=741276 RepID=A0A2S5B0A5_9BASI|nr:hypothetical protein BMF94_6796 [Rhodotorula taiwanensis]
MAGTETTPLLHADGEGQQSTTVQESRRGVRRTAALVIIPYFLFSVLAGASATVEIEAIGQIACRLVVAVPVPSASDKERLEWEAMCRVAPDVLARTSSVVTEILLIAGVLSAMTAAWWGGISDRKGRRIILGITSAVDIVTNIVMVLVLAYPAKFGYGWLLGSAVVAGLGGGQLASTAIGATYLSDLATPETKTQILSLYEAANWGGLALGPLLGPYLMQVRGLGVTAPYVGLLLSRLAFIAMLPFLRETLPAKRVDLFETSGPDEVPDKPSSFFASFFAAPLALLRPLSVLVPDKVNGRRDYRLPLIAASYGLFMIVPGLGPVKILFARGQFGWGPLETGRFITFTGILKLVVLVGVVPLAARLLRKADTPTNEPEETMEDIEVPVSSSRQPTGSRSSVWDLALAKTSISLALIGYLAMLLPARNRLMPFLVGSGFTAFAAAAPPAILSLALAFSPAEDSGKVLASLSAIATVSVTAIGPSLFGAVYVAVLRWWPQFVFLLAAMWVASSLIPLFAIRLRRPGAAPLPSAL